jgi:hypothetical protein
VYQGKLELGLLPALMIKVGNRWIIIRGMRY